MILVIYNNLEWLNVLWKVDLVKAQTNKTIFDTTDNMTACMKCLKLKWAAKDAHCEACNAWFHYDCGTQKNMSTFKCPLCNLVNSVKPEK